MREWTSKILGGFKTNNVSKLNSVKPLAQTASATTVQMTGVYAKFNNEYTPKTVTTTIPDHVVNKYSGIEPSAYKPGGADQTTAFYNNLKQEGMNDVDSASNKYLDDEPALT